MWSLSSVPVSCTFSAHFFPETLDTALGCGFSSSDDYLQLWHCCCDYARRKVDDWSEGIIGAYYIDSPLIYVSNRTLLLAPS